MVPAADGGGSIFARRSAAELATRNARWCTSTAHRMVRRNRIEIGGQQIALFRELALVPSIALQPFAGFNFAIPARTRARASATSDTSLRFTW